MPFGRRNRSLLGSLTALAFCLKQPPGEGEGAVIIEVGI